MSSAALRAGANVHIDGRMGCLGLADIAFAIRENHFPLRRLMLPGVCLLLPIVERLYPYSFFAGLASQHEMCNSAPSLVSLPHKLRILDSIRF